MKVAIVHSYYSSKQPSGENAVVDAQANALREAGVNVHVVAARTDDEELKPAYKLRTAVRVSTGWGPSPRADLDAYAPDIVHVHNLFPNWGTAWIDDWSGPLITTLHNFRPVCAAGTLFRNGSVCTACPDSTSLQAVRHACYRGSRAASLPLAVRNLRGIAGDPLLSRSARVVLLSSRAQEMYASFGLPRERTVVVPNFVPDEGFSPEAAPGVEWVYIGRLAPEKGVSRLIAHWPENEQLAIYGDGPLRGEVERAVAPNIRYMGHLGHAQIPSVLAKSRGLVFPSEWAEGLPLVYAEALASGRVVVAKSGNSAADDVAAAGTGRVFESWSELAPALKQAGANLKTIGAVSRAHYEKAFSRDTWVAKTLDVYNGALKGRHG